MVKTATLETVDVDRRRLLTTTATGIAVAGAASLLPTNSAFAVAPDDIRPFKVHVPEEQLVDLRRRLAATRWPDKETVANQLQGAQLAKLQELVRHWATDYDWRKGEAKLNAFPQFKTTIDGVEIHFIHVRSRHPNALPLIITHGWPGSVFEQIKPIGGLTDPTSYGGRAEDAFHVVIPSLPGYGFSSRPTETAGEWSALAVRGTCS
jgi:Epoxide hydrolase N terminus